MRTALRAWQHAAALGALARLGAAPETVHDEALVPLGGLRLDQHRYSGRPATHLLHHLAQTGALACGVSVGEHAALCFSLGEALPRARLLVNTTSLGMKGQPALEIDVGLLPAQAVVADLVYVPLDTPLLAAARARGLHTCPQEAWSKYTKIVLPHIGAGAEEMMVCSMALGWADESAPVNGMPTPREPVEAFTRWVE